MMVAGIDQRGVGIKEAGDDLRFTFLCGSYQLLVRVHHVSPQTNSTSPINARIESDADPSAVPAPELLGHLHFQAAWAVIHIPRDGLGLSKNPAKIRRFVRNPVDVLG